MLSMGPVRIDETQAANVDTKVAVQNPQCISIILSDDQDNIAKYKLQY